MTCGRAIALKIFRYTHNTHQLHLVTMFHCPYLLKMRGPKYQGEIHKTMTNLTVRVRASPQVNSRGCGSR